MTTTATAANFELLIDRSANAIELFVSLPADAAPRALGADLAALNGLTTGVDYTLLQNGTWTQGDALFSGVEILANGAPATFEAMSIMVHPKDQALPFRNPIDALTAISVCGVPVPQTPPSLEEMHAYGGFIAYPVDGTANLRVRLGNTAPISVKVTELQGEMQRTEVVYLPTNGTLDLRPLKEPVTLMPMLTALTLSALSVYFFAGRLRRQQKTPQPLRPGRV